MSHDRSSHVIGQREVRDFTEKLAWKRSGFENRAALEQAVRDLPLEKKVALLVELKMSELAPMLWEEKQNFLLNLGKKTWVDGEEIHEYAEKTYTDDMWIIEDVICFQPETVHKGSYVSQMNMTHIENLEKQRKAK